MPQNGRENTGSGGQWQRRSSARCFLVDDVLQPAPKSQAVTRTKKPSSGIQKLVEQINRLQVERGSLQEQLLTTQLNLEQAKLDAAGGQKFLQEKQQDQEKKQHQAEKDKLFCLSVLQGC
uniref:Uncharacterized protein n=1 Tax=Branchiostoma floridae TaxID=7739 RepID=C3YSS9_BRAFL|eukprot:XP_002600581.1 hypothetical protein BRAFLDRAFT_101639 [Branchiostoma floridae]